LAYLPNAMVGALSFASGPGFSIGPASIAPFAFHGGAVPAVPLLAAVPAAAAHWWFVLLALPAAVGVLVGLVARGWDQPWTARLRAIAVAGLVAGGGCLVLAALSGGALAGGPFDPVTVPAGLLGATAFGWITVAGGLAGVIGKID
jgi:hypothetical protein